MLARLMSTYVDVSVLPTRVHVLRPFLIIPFSLDVELLFLHRKDGGYCDYHVHGAYRKMQGGRGEFQSGWVMSTSTCCTSVQVVL